MIISDTLTIGQITFIFRVAIQILAYGGMSLIGIIILGNAPHVGPIDTHDVINRIIGAASATPATAKWIFNRIRRNNTDHHPPNNLIVILFLSMSYAAFVSLSDIEFLGFYACPVPGPTLTDTPASVKSDVAARNVITANMVNGTDPGKVKAYRYDSIEVINFGAGVFENVCTSWRNSTYVDINLFSGINSTDTDVLMPRQLSHHRHSKEATLDLNSYYVGPNTQRVTKTMIQNGLVVEPHEQGVRMISGVPQLTADHKVDIEKTLAVEVDVGCMTTGITSIHLVVESGFGVDLFQINGTWREYTGPDYMQDILSKAVDDARAYYEPLFNKTTLSSTGSIANDGVLIGLSLSIAANVRSYRLSTANFSITDKTHQYILGNCTQALQNRLGIAFLEKRQGSMCNYLGIGGSIASDGAIGKGFRKMICASAAQINMVSATVSVDANQAVSVNV